MPRYWIVDIIRKFGQQTNITLDTQNFARAEMLVRKPAEVVFEELINPEVTSKFWVTGSSGMLEYDVRPNLVADRFHR